MSDLIERRDAIRNHPTVAKAEALLPLIKQYLEAGEKQARLHANVVSAVGGAGLCRIAAPRVVGGEEGTLSVITACADTVSRADPAVAWLIGNSTIACHASAYLEAGGRERLFADPDRPFSTSAVPMGQGSPCDGGYRLTGRWPVVSGSEDSDWAALAGFVMEDDKPKAIDGGFDVRMFLVKLDDVIIHRTWENASAMRGTGSNAVSAENVFVEEALAHTTAKSLQIDSPIYRLPATIVFAPVVGAAACGVLQTAVETATAEISSKISSFSGQPMRNSAVIRELIINARSTVRALRAGLYEAVAEIDYALESGTEVSQLMKADLYGAIFYCVTTARRTISELQATGSRDGFFAGNPVERAFRNLHAIELGFNGVRALLESAGNVALGGEPEHPAF